MGAKDLKIRNEDIEERLEELLQERDDYVLEANHTVGRYNVVIVELQKLLGIDPEPIEEQPAEQLEEKQENRNNEKVR